MPGRLRRLDRNTRYLSFAVGVTNPDPKHAKHVCCPCATVAGVDGIPGVAASNTGWIVAALASVPVDAFCSAGGSAVFSVLARPILPTSTSSEEFSAAVPVSLAAFLVPVPGLVDSLVADGRAASVASEQV